MCQNMWYLKGLVKGSDLTFSLFQPYVKLENMPYLKRQFKRGWLNLGLFQLHVKVKGTCQKNVWYFGILKV